MQTQSRAEEIVERVFARLGAIYGKRFAEMWDTADNEAMRKTWAARLAHYSPPSILGALEACEEGRTIKRPPTLPEFVELCRASSAPVERPMLEAPRVPMSNPSAAELEVAGMYPKPSPFGSGDRVWWARRIVRLAELGESPGNYSVMVARDAIARYDGGLDPEARA